jgi:hypothetical protein
MNNTQLLFNPSYPLTKTDFDPEPVHRIIFITTCKLAEAGAGSVSEVEIDNYVKDYPAQYETLNDSNFLDFVPTVKELCSPESFELYYTTLRKFSLLRELKEDGYNIADYYDEMLDETEQMAKLNKWTIGEILTDIEFKSAKLRTKYDVKYVRNEIKAGQMYVKLNSFLTNILFAKIGLSMTVLKGVVVRNISCQLVKIFFGILIATTIHLIKYRPLLKRKQVGLV